MTESTELRLRVKLVPVTSTWICPYCTSRNVYRQGVVDDPQNACGICGLRVTLEESRGGERHPPSLTQDYVEAQAIKERLAKAVETIKALNHNERQWSLSIPARPEHDPDLIISASLHDIDYLLYRLEQRQ